MMMVVISLYYWRWLCRFGFMHTFLFMGIVAFICFADLINKQSSVQCLYFPGCLLHQVV